MSSLTVRQRAYLHHYGPWIVGGGVVVIALGIEAAKHHVISETSVLFFLILIPTIIIHEITHGVVAYWCGDSTAKDAHRLSLNPLRHIDPLGTILVPILLIVTAGVAFGWAKPVPVNVSRLRHPRNQAVVVSLAGPGINLLIALVMGVLLHIFGGSSLDDPIFQNWSLLDQILLLAGSTNVVIAVFNLIPIPPLDGSVVLERFLPANALPTYYRLRSFSMILVIVVVFWLPGVLDALFNHSLLIWESIVRLPQFQLF